MFGVLGVSLAVAMSAGAETIRVLREEHVHDRLEEYGRALEAAHGTCLSGF